MDIVSQVPRAILSAEFVFGGWVRVSSWPFKSINAQANRKNAVIAPILYPLVPFRDAVGHNRWVGAWMIGTGVLLASRTWARSKATLALVLFWTSAGAWSQRKADMSYWLPIVNFSLGWLVWWIENRDQSEARRTEY